MGDKVGIETRQIKREWVWDMATKGGRRRLEWNKEAKEGVGGDWEIGDRGTEVERRCKMPAWGHRAHKPHKPHHTIIWFRYNTVYSNMDTQTHTLLYARQRNAEYTYPQRRQKKQTTVFSLYFHHVPDDPYWAVVMNCRWTDILFFLSTTQLKITLLALTEHCITILYGSLFFKEDHEWWKKKVLLAIFTFFFPHRGWSKTGETTALTQKCVLFSQRQEIWVGGTECKEVCA